ncbi:hypothetical protein TUM4637_22460 [Shewanella hafniensis]|uniref:hypothetical protein n=1 Tax=Shewanella hafniensis TaxID=365590 RepID=UPI001BBF14C5|nr:hypothetical protein [Shewanella hafniensis]MCL1135984.1 hypothetical protein [Shewanella hafniensis]GIU31080.1 hypothetical protein TUM4637_22460 [Shewanella hafniensis]
MFRQVYIDGLLEKLEDQEFRDYAFNALKIFRSEPWSIDDGDTVSMPFIDIYCQKPKGMEINLIDWIEAALAWQRVLSNTMIYKFIQCPALAKKDANIKGNNQIISSLTELYSGIIKDSGFYGGNYGADGHIEFFKPPLSNNTYFPLEVGYCSSDQINTHIFTNNCFARLPYNSEYIVIFEVIQNYLS